MIDIAPTWVVGVDGTDNSIVALRWAIARAASSASSGHPGVESFGGGVPIE